MSTFFTRKHPNPAPGHNLTKLVLSLIAILFIAPVYAVNTAPASTQIVYLRTDCTSQDNCFDNMGSLLTWIQSTRAPATAPLLIEAGPGEFFDFRCEAFHNVTLRGAGRGKTTISYQNNYRNAAVSASNCSGLNFHDISIDGNTDGLGVWWVDGTGGSFHNVNVINSSIGVYDYCLYVTQPPVIKWYDSTLGASKNEVLKSGCAQHWFFGSEIEQVLTGSVNGKLGAWTIRLYGFGGTGDARFYGSSIRTTVDSSVTAGKVISVYNEWGTFHSHGGEIVTNASGGNGDINVIAVKNVNGIKTHIVDTSFGLVAGGTGSAIRIDGPKSTVFSPFQWPASANPPAIASKNGYDSFVETDCDSAGNCDGSGNLTHTMIYNKAACGDTDPWFNATTNRCRNVAN